MRGNLDEGARRNKIFRFQDREATSLALGPFVDRRRTRECVGYVRSNRTVVVDLLETFPTSGSDDNEVGRGVRRE